MKIAGISGSLRQHSINRGVLRTVADHLAKQDIEFTAVDISDFPLYDQDLNSQGIPEAVMRVHNQLKAADAIVLASPEYNYSISGVLKNAIDWLSRLRVRRSMAKPFPSWGHRPAWEPPAVSTTCDRCWCL